MKLFDYSTTERVRQVLETDRLYRGVSSKDAFVCDERYLLSQYFRLLPDCMSVDVSLTDEGLYRINIVAYADRLLEVEGLPPAKN